MGNRTFRVFLPIVALLALLTALGGCGTNTGSPGGSVKPPDRVQIQIAPARPGGKNPPVTLRLVSLVQRLYNTTSALPAMPPNLACTAEAGPSYTLIFFQGEKMLATVEAQRFGCQAVTIEGSRQVHRAITDFWSLVDQAVYAATPVGTPQWLAVQHTAQGDRPAETARITSVETVHRLYNAILALPLVSRENNCSAEPMPAYQLLFHAENQTITSLISDRCNTISLDGKGQTRSGLYLMDATFKSLLAQTLAGARFSPARADRLSLESIAAKGVASYQMVTDVNLMQQLYTKVFALPAGTLPPDCPSSADKMAGKGKWYQFSFTQWDLPILSFSAYEGSCKLVTLADGKVLREDEAFWSLVHRAAGFPA